MLKPSKYNIIEYLGENNEGVIILNLLSRGVILLPTEVWNRYSDSTIINLSKTEREDLKRLQNEGYFVDQEVDEMFRARWFIRRALAQRDAYGFTISPTLYCNLACTYCYECSLYKSTEKTTYNMKPKVQQSTISWIKCQIEKQNLKKINLGFYGGEPFLCPDIVKNISRELGNYCVNNKIEIYLTITSNGTMLTAELLKEILGISHANKTIIQFTIDGPPDIHNIRRPMKSNEEDGGRSSFDLTFSNLLGVVDIVRPTVRINLDKQNIDSIDDLLTIFDNHGLREKIHIYFYPTMSCNKSCDEFIFTDAEINKEMARAWSIAQNYGYHISAPLQRGICADANGRSINIGPNGNLHSCQGFITVDSFACGNVNSDRFNDHYLEHLNLNNWEKCIDEGCEMVTVCAGGCRERAFEELGNWKIRHCKKDVIRESMKYYLKYSYKNEIDELLKNYI